jgi:hypothetical protein
MKKRNNPSTTLLLLGVAGAGAAYYFLIHKPKREKDAAKSVVASVAPPTMQKLTGGITGKQTGYSLPSLSTSGRLSESSKGGVSFPPLTLSGGSLGNGGAGSLG